MQVSDYPERAGQPECSYFMKTGDYKYKATCKFHHPKSRINKAAPSVLSDKGLPLRPDQNICSHYSRYGICKYGPACKYDHPVNYSNSIPARQRKHDEQQRKNMMQLQKWMKMFNLTDIYLLIIELMCFRDEYAQ